MESNPKNDMINFATFESLGAKTGPSTDPIYIHEPQGKLRRTAAVKVWNKIGVGKSDVHDKGVFCVDYIKKDEIFEVAPILIIPSEIPKGNTLIDYVFKIDDDTCAIAFGYASIYNHRNMPMCSYKISEEAATITFTALRDIIPGEEIFSSYGKNYWNTRDISAKSSPDMNKIK